MKKIILIVSAVLVTAGLYAQTQVLETTSGSSHNVTIGVSNGVNSNFIWTPAGDGIFSSWSTSSTATTTSASFDVTGTDGQSATLSVSVSSSAGLFCPGGDSVLTVRIVTTPTFTASIAAGPQTVCQNSAAASTSVALSSTAGTGTINSFTYYVDANNSNTQDAGETSQVVPVNLAVPATGTIPAISTAIYGVQAVRVISVNGTTLAGATLNSAQTGVAQTITIEQLPVLGNFSF